MLLMLIGLVVGRGKADGGSGTGNNWVARNSARKKEQCALGDGMRGPWKAGNEIIYRGCSEVASRGARAGLVQSNWVIDVPVAMVVFTLLIWIQLECAHDDGFAIA